jgi:hypothetical protein
VLKPLAIQTNGSKDILSLNFFIVENKRKAIPVPPLFLTKASKLHKTTIFEAEFTAQYLFW